jgi:hypothetical protein
MTHLLELIVFFDLPAMATFAVGFVLWHLGIREPFVLTFLSLLLGAGPVYVVQLRKPQPEKPTAWGNRRKVGRPEENTHPAAR